MNCGLHLETAAVAVCCECGNGVCAACRNKMFGRNYCDVCAAKVEEKLMAPRPPAPVAPAALPVPVEGKNPTTAAIFSALFPGAGQIYAGRVARGVGILVGTVVLTPIFVGVLLYVAQIFDAVHVTKEENEKALLLGRS